MRVLLVEPDKVLADIYSQALRAEGCEVTAVRGAQAAVHAADEKKPEVIILELQLVAHSGIEFLYELRSYPEWQDIPVIIQSQIPPGEFKDSLTIMRQLGVNSYLYKPQTSLEQLVKEIKRMAVPA